jgi:nitrile hydratase beta subunit
VDGIHDLGGMHGFGAVGHQPDGPAFEGEWERLVFGIVTALAVGGLVSPHRLRYAIERMPPLEYLRTSYYEHSLHGLEDLLVAQGVVTADELAARVAEFVERPDTEMPDAPAEPRVTRSEGRRPDADPARFAVGDRVRVKNNHSPGHTRAPRYCRGRRGVVAEVYPAYLLPDLYVAEGVEEFHHTCLVEFDAAELWGEDAEPRESVRVDLWEPYLEPVGEQRG